MEQQQKEEVYPKMEQQQKVVVYPKKEQQQKEEVYSKMEQQQKEEVTETEAIWIRHIPVPRVLELMVQELGKSGLPDLEEILLDLCFSLPPNGNACLRLLRSLPKSSPVWDKLEDGVVSNHLFLPPKIMLALYQHRPAFLENHIFETFGRYAQVASAYERDVVSEFTVEYFESRGNFAEDTSGEGGVDDGEGVLSKDPLTKSLISNFWKNSCLVDAVAHSNSLFAVCLKIFIRLGIDTEFSVAYMAGSQDFFSVLFCKMDREMFKIFPTHLQHIAFLLTLPLCISADRQALGNHSQIHIVQSGLLEVLKEEGAAVVQAFLSFFPFWLHSLSQTQFLDRYLKFTPSDFEENFNS